MSSRLAWGIRFASLTVALGWLSPASLLAVDLYWSGAGTWDTTSANWGTSSGGPYDATAWSNITPDAAIFQGTGGTVTLGEPITAAAITFDVTGYTVTAGTLTLSGTPTIVANADATIASTVAGTAGLTKTGAGTLTLSGSRTFTGTATVSAGTLKLTTSGALGTSVTIDGGTLELSGAGANILSNSQPVTVNAGGTLLAASTTTNAHTLDTLTLNGGTLASSALDSVFGNFVLTNVTVAGSSRSTIESLTIAKRSTSSNLTFAVSDVTPGTDLLVSSVVRNSNTDATRIVKSGAGTMELTGTNTYSGGTTLSDGILKITGSGNAGTGAVTINGGTLELARATFNALNTSQAITINAGGTLLAANTVNNAHTLGGLTLNGGSLSSNLVDDSTFGNFLLGSVTAGGSSRSTIDANSISRRSDATNLTFAVADATSGTDLLVSAVIKNNSTNATRFIKSGAGTMELTGNNTYTGGTTISAGTILAGSSTALGTGVVNVSAGATVMSAAGVSLSNTRNLSAGTLGFISNAAAGTVALLEAGTSGTPQALPATTAWASEIAGVTYSDVLTLTNTSGIAQVLTMEFDPTGLDQATIDSLQLSWLDTATSTWVNAIDGNSGGTPAFFTGSWADYVTATSGATPANSLGVFGRDTVGNNVWAVIDHNSDFAVISVPEPTTGVILLAAGMAAGLFFRRVRS